MKTTKIPLQEEKKEMIPEIQLQCPNCKITMNVEAMHRIYRAYMVLTRQNRSARFNASCVNCGKHTQVRIRPLHPEYYKCRKCQMIAEKEGLIGYKPNPTSYKRI